MQPPCFIAAVGQRFAGKSNETLRQCYWALRGVPEKGIRGVPVIIFDNNDEYGAYNFNGSVVNIKRIDIKHIPIMCGNPYPEIRRVVPVDKNGMMIEEYEERLKILKQLLNTAYNCIIVIEDINKLVGDNIPDNIIGAVSTLRQRGQHIITHFQGVGRVGQPKILANLNYIRMHRTRDSVERHEGKFQEITDMMSVAEYIIDKKFFYGQEIGDRIMQTYNLTIDIDHGKIRGFVTKQEAEDAIQFYLAKNGKSVLSTYKNMTDRAGKKLYTHETAYSMIEQKMFNDFFSFPKNKSTQKK